MARGEGGCDRTLADDDGQALMVKTLTHLSLSTNTAQRKARVENTPTHIRSHVHTDTHTRRTRCEPLKTPELDRVAMPSDADGGGGVCGTVRGFAQCVRGSVV